MRKRLRGSALLVVLLAALPAGQSTLADDDEKQDARPERSGLVERTGRRLAQLDVTVSGPDEEVGALEREDFELVVGTKRFDEFIVDRICEAAEGGEVREIEELRTEDQLPPPAPIPEGPKPTYLFYFDQIHLTQRGRNEGLQTAEELVPELIRDGARGMVVSAADDIVTYAELTDDPQVVLEAVRELHGDMHWDPYAQDEGLRVEEVIRAFRDDSRQGEIVARRFQMEERWRSSRALRRFAMVLGRMADLDPPKAVLYFADTMRSNPGQHYLDLLPSGLHHNAGIAGAMEADSFSAYNDFDRVLNEAASHGIRLYAIHAQGLVTLSASSLGSRNNQGLSSARSRISQAEDSLRSFAAETGGEAFVGGYSTKRIVRTIREDLSCLYLISFDPTGLTLDGPLDVKVTVNRPKVKTQVRGRIVIQSDSARLTSELLAAFGAPSTVGDGGEIYGSVIPGGYEDGRFRARLQVHVPGVPISGAVWDVGASVVARERVLEDLSERVEVSGPGVPVVLETEASFRPGPFSMVSVAHESVTDQTASKETRGEWPDPLDQEAAVSSLAILQPGSAIFVRNGEIRRKGALAVPPGHPVLTDRQTAFVGIVCWDKSQKKTLTVERTLSGDSSASFEPREIEANKDRCAHLVDVVPESTMTEGGFVYRVDVWSGERLLASAERSFLASDPAAEDTGSR